MASTSTSTLTLHQLLHRINFKSIPYSDTKISIGCHSKVAYEFHLYREDNPGKCYSQFVNKVSYAKEGARDIIDRACANLP